MDRHQQTQMTMAMFGPKPESEDDDHFCEFRDVSRAHFHALIERNVFVRIDGEVYPLGRTTYGLQDAGAAFDKMSGIFAVDLARSPIACSRLEAWWLSATGTTTLCLVRDAR